MLELQSNLNQKGLDQVSQGPVQSSIEYPQGWKSYSLSGFLFQCFTTLTVEMFFQIRVQF